MGKQRELEKLKNQKKLENLKQLEKLKNRRAIFEGAVTYPPETAREDVAVPDARKHEAGNVSVKNLPVSINIVGKNEIGNVFVKDLPGSINNTGLQDVFTEFGNNDSYKLATSEFGKSGSYGFIQYDKQDAAIGFTYGTIVADKEIYVGQFFNLYTKNLLRQNISEFGKIVSLAIAKEENGSCKGFAFVNFNNPEDAKRATQALNGTQLGSKSMYVGRAQKKAGQEKLLKEQLKPQLDSKITGRIVEMNKSELLLLLKSPQHLAAKVDEALEVLKSSKTNLASPNTLALMTWRLAFGLIE